jgi:DNA topoisomerase-3
VTEAHPKPIQRLWLQSMTPQAIRDGFDKLRSDAQMLGLADAARSRSEADWLVGINGTRAMTAFNSRDGGFFLTTVGRVQTPTLSIVVEREEKIRKHVARDYWEVRADFDAQAGSTRASGSTRSGRRTRRRRAARRPAVDTAADAEAIRAAVLGQPHVVTEEAKPSNQSSPLPVRPDHAAARGQLALRLQRQDHAVDRAGAVREAQGADLPADRFARTCPRTTWRW